MQTAAAPVKPKTPPKPATAFKYPHQLSILIDGNIRAQYPLDNDPRTAAALAAELRKIVAILETPIL